MRVQDCVIETFAERKDSYTLFVDELECVHVPRRNDDLKRIIVFCLLDDRSEHVIRLESFGLVCRNVQCSEHVTTSLDLCDELIVCFHACRFVSLKCDMAV